MLKIGEKLPNGGIVLEFGEIEKDRRYMVLCLVNDEFVTWEVGQQNGNTEAYWGHYFGTVERALEDYLRRYYNQ